MTSPSPNVQPPPGTGSEARPCRPASSRSVTFVCPGSGTLTRSPGLRFEVGIVVAGIARVQRLILELWRRVAVLPVVVALVLDELLAQRDQRCGLPAIDAEVLGCRAH